MAEPVELRVPFATMLRVALFVLLAVIVVKLWPVIIMLFVAVQLAIVLDPLAGWLTRHHFRRGAAIALVAVVLFSVTAFVVFGALPAAYVQVRDLGNELPRLAAAVSRYIPQARPLIEELSAKAQRPPDAARLQRILTRGLVAGRYALGGITAIVLVEVFAVYLIVQGRAAWEWLLAFASPSHREKLRRTATGVCPIVFAYMRGQAITCFLCGGVALVTLLLLRIPGAAVLALIAFVLDLIPVVGTIAMMAPAIAIALVVSPLKALIVFLVYLAYHLVESYWIVPRVYGAQMRLSTLTVLVAVTAGAALQGPIGAVLVLPLVAAYPVIERIWLVRVVGEEAVERHEEIETGDPV